MVRESLGMPGLFIFDGNEKQDVINRIEVFYHRHTKIEAKISEKMEYAIWDYTESLKLDRSTETIEHIQNMSSGCSINRTYRIEDGVRDFLDRFDVKNIFSNIEGNPEDVFVDPLESLDYTIKVFTKRGEEKSIQGTYDKKGLPDDWSDFIESVYEFISFYGLGEIMSSSVYEKVRRRNGDLIYCSVEFESGYKSYYYITDDDSIEAGNFVIVPAGADNHEAIVEVVKKEYFSKDAVPLPVEKTKHIIRKCTDDDLTLMDE